MQENCSYLGQFLASLYPPSPSRWPSSSKLPEYDSILLRWILPEHDAGLLSFLLCMYILIRPTQIASDCRYGQKMAHASADIPVHTHAPYRECLYSLHTLMMPPCISFCPSPSLFLFRCLPEHADTLIPRAMCASATVKRMIGSLHSDTYQVSASKLHAVFHDRDCLCHLL